MSTLSTVQPAYGRASLADILPSALAVLGVPGSPDPLALVERLAGVRRVAVLLIDGMGAHQLPAAAPVAPTLTELAGGRAGLALSLTSGFPSTTPPSLVTLGTGSPPGAHGVLGFSVNLPGTDRILNHIEWDGDPDPASWQPVPTQWERAEAAGVTVTTVSRPEFYGTGLTTASNRGGDYRGASTIDGLVTEILGALSVGDGPVLVSGYHPDLDKAGHLFGLQSPEWLAAAAEVDRLVTRLIDGLPPDGALLVTADHGQLDIPAQGRLDIDSDPRLGSGLRLVAGEPRVRYLHVLPGALDDVLSAWRAVLGDDAWVMPRDEAVAAGWFGPVNSDHLLRVGDVVVICQNRQVVLATAREAPLVASLIAYHGSCTAAEMMIPLLIARGV